MTDNNDRMDQLLEATMPDIKAIRDLMVESEVMAIDVLKALYFISNIKKISKYGKVGFTIKNNEIVAVWQEQQLISDKELVKNLNALMNKG
jgi:hypothetical protein